MKYLFSIKSKILFTVLFSLIFVMKANITLAEDGDLYDLENRAIKYELSKNSNDFQMKNDVLLECIINCKKYGYEYGGEVYKLTDIINAYKNNKGDIKNEKISFYNILNYVKSHNKPVFSVPNKAMGNTNTNIMNGGMVVEKNGWIYYSNPYDNGAIYKVRTDRTQYTKLNNEESCSINVIGGMVIYCNYNGEIYIMNTDGTERKKVTNDKAIYEKNMIVFGEWIYFIGDEYNIYKIKTDGTGRKKIIDDKVSKFVIKDNWIYYVCSYYAYGGLYKIDINGNGKAKINSVNVSLLGNIDVQDNWIYYVNSEAECNIYKIRTDGTCNTKVGDDRNVQRMNILGDWIYYLYGSNRCKIYKIRTDGTERAQVTDNPGWKINITGNWVYYKNGYYSDNICRKREELFSEEKMIKEINEIKISIPENCKYELPMYIKANMMDGSTRYVVVTWDNVKIDTSKIGICNYNGKVNRFKEKVKLTVQVDPKEVPVKNMIIERAEQISNNYLKLTLNTDYPENYEVYFKDKKLKYLPKDKIFVGTVDSDIEETIKTNLKVTHFNDGKIIKFSDINFEWLIRRKINKLKGDIFKYDVKEIIELHAEKRGISNINGMENFVNLQKLDLSDNNVSDLTPLKGLANLNYLDLSWNDMDDIDALGNLTGLKNLYIMGTRIYDFEVLKKFTNLMELEIQPNTIEDKEILKMLINLEILNYHEVNR